MWTSLSRRNLATLDAVARVFVPHGGTIALGADDVALGPRVAAEVASYPPGARRRVRLLLTACEWLPLLTKRRRRFTRLDAEARGAVLEANYHHAFFLRRMIVSFLKQLVYTSYLSVPEVEDAVGYRYECARPLDGVSGDRVHH